MVVGLLTKAEQIEKLRVVAAIIGRAEVNFGMRIPVGDVVYLEAVDTPKASQIVYANDGPGYGYDIWKWGPKQHRISEWNVSAERAAEVVVAEYLWAKAKRIKKHRPDLPLDTIMKTLSAGYQRKPETKQ